jgi:MFS family permease
MQLSITHQLSSGILVYQTIPRQLLASGVVGILIFVSTIPAVPYIDRLGRKPILTVGAICVATWYLFDSFTKFLVRYFMADRLNSYIVVVVLVAKNQNNWTAQPAAGWAAISMVWLFIVHFGYSFGACAWIIVSEVWPLSNRPYGIALGASSNWMNVGTEKLLYVRYTKERNITCDGDMQCSHGNILDRLFRSMHGSLWKV